MDTKARLNGPVDEALKRLAADAYGVPPDSVTPEFVAQKKDEEASQRRLLEERFREQYQRWARAFHSSQP
jgi:hypothetical protein